MYPGKFMRDNVVALLSIVIVALPNFRINKELNCGNLNTKALREACMWLHFIWQSLSH